MPDGSIDPTIDYLAQFSADSGKKWPTMAAAQTDAVAVQELLLEQLQEFTSEDVDVVVFGSLARREWTSGSDVDWTMLVDGQTDTQHRVAAREIDMTLADMKYKNISLKGPGAEGIFGNMAFSHEIVHHIGGQADTNRNTTQRVLMLLEATSITTASDDIGAYERTVRQILNRYLMSDSNFHNQVDNESRIPRFLLNDVVRYWRTMCVDFAYKDWEQAGNKWAIRNIKLRTSRKLLFVAGLFMVFSCYKNESLRSDGENSGDNQLKMQKHLLNFVHSTPLNILVWALRELTLDEPCEVFLSIYEEFLAQINDETVRGHLGTLSEDTVYTDEFFLKCREISHRLQATLIKMCFEIDTPLRDFTCEYGVF